MQEKRAADKERLLLELQEGDIKTGRITSIRDFGIFVDIGGADGLVHLSELSWERTPNSPHELFKAGEEIPVYVLKVDNEARRSPSASAALSPSAGKRSSPDIARARSSPAR